MYAAAFCIWDLLVLGSDFGGIKEPDSPIHTGIRSNAWLSGTYQCFVLNQRPTAFVPPTPAVIALHPEQVGRTRRLRFLVGCYTSLLADGIAD
jgi:hypothetical protein